MERSGVRGAAVAAEVGVGQRALDMTVAFVSERRQFGVAVEVTGSAIQAHGGIGFTWEADVHWLFKRAQLDAALPGSASRRRIALARAVAARPAFANGRH
jgi:alkylation response protein AidB-like acyl-CoA dehydrogenase